MRRALSKKPLSSWLPRSTSEINFHPLEAPTSYCLHLEVRDMAHLFQLRTSTSSFFEKLIFQSILGHRGCTIYMNATQHHESTNTIDPLLLISSIPNSLISTDFLDLIKRGTRTINSIKIAFNKHRLTAARCEIFRTLNKLTCSDLFSYQP